MNNYGSSITEIQIRLNELLIKYEDKLKIYRALQKEFSTQNHTNIDFEKIEAELDDLQSKILQLKKNLISFILNN